MTDSFIIVLELSCHWYLPSIFKLEKAWQLFGICCQIFFWTICQISFWKIQSKITWFKKLKEAVKPCYHLNTHWSVYLGLFTEWSTFLKLTTDNCHQPAPRNAPEIKSFETESTVSSRPSPNIISYRHWNVKCLLCHFKADKCFWWFTLFLISYNVSFQNIFWTTWRFIAPSNALKTTIHINTMAECFYLLFPPVSYPV